VIWVSWRLQRTETLIAAGILALLAALLIPTGLEMGNAYHHDGLAACTGANVSESCNQAIGAFTERFRQVGDLLAWFTLLPGLIGVLLATPFILELENGTYRLAWTQSITRRRWIVSKLAIAIGAALVVAVALTLLVTWWRSPLVHLQGRMDASVFDAEGIVVFGYILFALGVATALGVVWRRAVPALVVAFAAYFVARIFVDTWLRQRLVSPLTATWSITGSQPAKLNHAWVLTQRPSDRLGQPTSLFRGCFPQPPLNGHAKLINPKEPNADCLLQHGAGFMHAVYHPASHFWILQGIETSLFAGTALILLAFSAWWTHRRAT
jgi:hypothetical protein